MHRVADLALGLTVVLAKRSCPSTSNIGVACIVPKSRIAAQSLWRLARPGSSALDLEAETSRASLEETACPTDSGFLGRAPGGSLPRPLLSPGWTYLHTPFLL
jgi:hypothetical protein